MTYGLEIRCAIPLFFREGDDRRQSRVYTDNIFAYFGEATPADIEMDSLLVSDAIEFVESLYNAPDLPPDQVAKIPRLLAYLHDQEHGPFLTQDEVRAKVEVKMHQAGLSEEEKDEERQHLQAFF